jgi:hypothetical protein
MVYQLDIDQVHQRIGKVVAKCIDSPQRIINQIYCGYDWPEQAALIEKRSRREPYVFKALVKGKSLYQKCKLQVLRDKIK